MLRPFLHFYLPILALTAGCDTRVILLIGPDSGPDTGEHKPLPEAGPPDVVVPVDANPSHALAVGQLEPQGLALSPTTVYWSNAGRLDDAGVAILHTGSIASIPRAGGTPTTLDPALDEPLVLSYGEGPGGVPTLVWSAGGPGTFQGTVNELVIPGNTLTVAASGQQFPYGVAMNASDLYWVSSNGTGVVIQSESLAGSTPMQLGETGEEYWSFPRSTSPSCVTG